MNFSYHTDDGIIITESRDLSDEALHADSVNHEEDVSFDDFEDQGVSIIKRPNLPPCIEIHDKASQEIMTKSGVEFVTCYLEDEE